MLPLRAVFLDAGQTLLYEEPTRFAIYAEAATARGRPIDPDAMRSLMGRVHHRLPVRIDGAARYSDPWFRRFIDEIFRGELGVSSELVADLEEELFARFESPATFHTYPGARELLAATRGAGLVVGMISNWSARLTPLLDALELSSSFDVVVCSALEGVEKPDPRIFRLALERARVTPAQALHAGDHPELDVAGARAVGLDAVLVDHRHGRADAGRATTSAGDRRVGSLDELTSYILSRA